MGNAVYLKNIGRGQGLKGLTVYVNNANLMLTFIEIYFNKFVMTHLICNSYIIKLCTIVIVIYARVACLTLF